ncbi:MAG TPA: CU044_2847 family protein [Allocoleopsis sp.]
MSSHQLVPIQSDDGTIIYIEAQENVDNLPISGTSPFASGEEVEQKRGGGKGWPGTGAKPVNVQNSMQMVQNTLRSYTAYTLNAFKNFGAGNIDEVTLEFGINFSADAGVPYIANGKAQSSMKITVKCSYNNPADKAEAAPTEEPVPQALNSPPPAQLTELAAQQAYGEVSRQLHNHQNSFRQPI